MIIQENIKKFTDLEKNDSLSSFMGHTSQQSHNTYQVFFDFISEVKPSRILEIGTALGGFTKFLKSTVDHLCLNTQLLSYDISERPWYDQMIANGIDVRVENIFNEDWSDVIDFVKTYVSSPGTTIVLCDSGWEIGEFKIFFKIIKPGDYILAHDYSLNKKIFEQNIKNEIWNWCEITEDDISDFVSQNNLESYKPEVFSQAVWVCKIKK